MPRRKWHANTKALIVLEGLKGKPLAERCTEPQISQSQYDQWRDQFLAHAGRALSRLVKKLKRPMFIGLTAPHRPPLLLHSTSVCPILTTNERLRLGWE